MESGLLAKQLRKGEAQRFKTLNGSRVGLANHEYCWRSFFINGLSHMRGQASDVPSHEAGMPLVWLLHMIRNEHNEQELRVVVINNGRVIIRLGGTFWTRY